MLELSVFPTLLLALIIDAIFGEPRVIFHYIQHPTQIMGLFIDKLDKRLNHAGDRKHIRRIKGSLLALILIVLSGSIGWVLFYLLSQLPIGWVFEAIILSTMIAAKSLYEHVTNVAKFLKEDNIKEARIAVSHIVGRDTVNLDEYGVARSTIESLAENLSDGVLAPIFWAILFGLPGAFIYKMLNTADSMIGYRNERYYYFGWAVARLDDIINFIPARITALILLLAALIWGRKDARRSWLAIRRDASKLESINAGYPEAAMAGALNVRLAGPRDYDERFFDGDWIGVANKGSTADVTFEDIDKSLNLYVNAYLISIAIIIFSTTWIS